ncbi:hypothetical protein E2C01_083156 [Portunus trituberculatus]|uniref:Uncharacterized protein n=1 Tax=Portunus trituberculatus TaxID=210409 RepID=A0A5B7J2P8_PORTR|nr:hypothetical protein [Portunus trituberculatus]
MLFVVGFEPTSDHTTTTLSTSNHYSTSSLGGSGLVDKVVSVGSDRRPHLGLNPTTYDLDNLPFVEWLKVTYILP